MELINRIVNVNAFYFHRSQVSDHHIKTFPRQIEFGNTRCTFKDGFQYLVKNGERMVRLFDMSDGHTTYRLRLENDEWMLVGTRPA